MRLTKILPIVVSSAVLAIPATSTAREFYPRVDRVEAASKKTLKKKARCQSNACHRRVAYKIQKKRMRLVVRPYRDWLYRVGQCESGGNYRANTGNGFYGKFQFMISTWYSVGGRGLPSNASKLEQDYRAVILLKRSGPGQWPSCGR